MVKVKPRGKLRIDEAIAFAKLNGKTVLKKELAAKLFPNRNEGAQQVCMTNICRGKTKRFLPEWIDIICDECGCTPNFLLGYEL